MTKAMNHQQYRILDMAANPVKAAAQFMYKGYEISFSTILFYPTEVAVFSDDKHISNHNTVQDAIEWINSQ